MMEQVHKVIWSEGMLLGPQHFQSWERYLLHQNQLLQQSISPFFWGIAELELDGSVLPQGELILKSCVGLLKDGRWIRFHESNENAFIFQIPENSKQPLAVHLALHKSEAVSGITGYPLPAEATYVSAYQSTRDLYDSEREREVLYAKQNLKLLVQQDLSPDLASLKIAELIFNPAQQAYQLNPDYIPPTISSGILARQVFWLAELKQRIRRLIDKVEKESSQDLVIHRTASEKVHRDGLLNTLKTQHHLIQSFSIHRSMPAYQLFERLQTVLASLMAHLPLDGFSMDSIAYEHENIYGCFKGLIEQIYQVLGNLTPNAFQVIPFEQISEQLYSTPKISLKLLQERPLYLCVYNDDMDKAFLNKMLRQIKLSAPSKIDRVAEQFTQGIGLEWVDSDSSDTCTHVNYAHFRLDKNAFDWKQVELEEQLIMWVSKSLVEAHFSLLIGS